MKILLFQTFFLHFVGENYGSISMDLEEIYFSNEDLTLEARTHYTDLTSADGYGLSIPVSKSSCSKISNMFDMGHRPIIMKLVV